MVSLFSTNIPDLLLRVFSIAFPSTWNIFPSSLTAFQISAQLSPSFVCFDHCGMPSTRTVPDMLSFPLYVQRPMLTANPLSQQIRKTLA